MQVPGVVLTGYDVAIAPRSLLRMDLDYFAQQEVVAAATMTPALSALQPFVALPHLALELGGVSIADKLVNANIRYNGNAVRRENAGTRYASGSHALRGSCECRLTLDFDDMREVADWFGTSPTTTPALPMAMTWPKNTEVLEFEWQSDELGSTTLPYELTAYMPRYRFTAVGRELPEGADAVFRLDITGRALRRETSPTLNPLTGEIIWQVHNRQTTANITT